MSTPNFKTMDNFDLYVYVYQSPSKSEIEQYCNDFEISVEDFSFESDYEFDYEMEYDNLKFLIKNNKMIQDLKYHTVNIESGYYEGFQICIDTEHDSPLNLDNEDCKYYYNTCRSIAIREFEAEIKKINNKILPYLADNSGLVKINCIGIFSNGEAIYELAS